MTHMAKLNELNYLYLPKYNASQKAKQSTLCPLSLTEWLFKGIPFGLVLYTHKRNNFHVMHLFPRIKKKRSCKATI